MRGSAAAPLLPGVAALVLILGTILAAFGALLWAAAGPLTGAALTDPYVGRVVRFSLWQAGLSTVLSVGLGIVVARALARRDFPGRTQLLRLFGLPLVVPVIVAVLGIVAVWGRSGWLGDGMDAAGLPRPQILYGLPGILIAHVFFNLPLATRLLLHAWQMVPGETWRLAAQLGMRSPHLFRAIEWPVLRRVVPGVAALVFFLCFTSFAVVLTLGGGPDATTMEVAIYQALRLEFDLNRAIVLATLQLGLCAVVALGLLAAGRPTALGIALGRPYARPDADAMPGRLLDALAIGLAAVFVLQPLAAIVVRGTTGPVAGVLGEPAVWRAAGLSLAVGCTAAIIAVTLAAALILASRTLRLRQGRARAAHLIELAASLVLVASPIVMGAGLFVLLRSFVAVLPLGLGLVVAIHGIVGVPYAVRLLGPAVHATGERFDRLCSALDVRGWNRLRLVEWPALRRPLGMALALIAAMGAGDLGVIALFGTQDTATLPLLLYQRMGAYRMDEAAVIALLLVTLALALYVVCERVVGGREGG